MGTSAPGAQSSGNDALFTPVAKECRTYFGPVKVDEGAVLIFGKVTAGERPLRAHRQFA